ncbi:MAG: SulP family inorganic anion transporter [Gammaproteobacteria bacterium]|nr:SulP family inorganic anion transporter [Gammaproteobacteria bacterium]MCW8928584.1 SulP family inorganic anion transporter [Gammaproteobacteria bacterium]MCW8959400.1 SulP family inorganic anion transporter [Gammaproteobacteria bacterium]MCW8972098.1 SulP family inorganic anion transporter [Gammaproteobacteria bacterium]MCW8993611.1 SulP family inorganic anion transporter [Gammaproteobacteria bacterium]
MIALVEAYRAGLFARNQWLSNIVAGVIVGVVALPLGMAFAIASGAKPEQGLYTAIVAGLLVSIFGGSRLQIAGPTGAFIVILAGITAEYGIEGLQLATLMAGIMLLGMGLLRMGGVIKFIPAPVIVGFTAGIGVIIWVGQWQHFFGLAAPQGQHFHEKFWQLLLSLPELHPATTLLALLSLSLVIYSNRIPGLNKMPGPLVAMVVVSAVQALFQFEGVVTIGSAFGGIPQQLPEIGLPAVSTERVIELIGPAFTIAMLGAIESLLSAVVADGMAGTRHNSNQELIGQGIANMATPLFGGFAATGAIARTATNIRNGGTSPLAGMVHALTLVVIILFLAPLAASIPLAALAAILFVVAWNMSEVKHFVYMVRRAPRADVAILLITFLLTVFADLVIAVNIGVILAMLQFMRRMASSVEVLQVGGKELGADGALTEGELPEGVLVYAIEGPFFFGAVETFERALVHTHTEPKVLVLYLKRVPFMDITGLQTLEEVIGDLERRGVKVMLCDASHKVKRKLQKAGILELIGEENYLQSCDETLVRCEAWLAESEARPAGTGE